MLTTKQYFRYRKSLKLAGRPVMGNDLPHVSLDLPGLMKYAKEQGKKVPELSEEEKTMFVKLIENDGE